MPATALLTSEQYLALPDQYDKNGNRIKDELIAGEVVPMPPASRIHDLIKNRINELLIVYLLGHKQLGLKSLVEIGAAVSTHDTFIPDVSVSSIQRLSVDGRVVRGAPELAIEVVSPYDKGKHLRRKVEAYLQGGSKTVWVINPDAKLVTVYSTGSIRELKGDQKVEDPLLPGFSTPVSAFFELT
jgi:Uma2 family endonuclease